MTLRVDDDRVRVRAPGKINLHLGVGDAMDDGYHRLATAFQAVSLFEDVVATASDDFTMSLTAAGVEIAEVPLDASNLALRAARLLAEKAGVSAGVHLDVRKGVPVAGGMGGGSADAAAALVACDGLWGTKQSATLLHALGAELGADVPFALLGGTALGVGRGDELSPALGRGRFDWVLVTSDEGLSTPAVYRELDRMRADGEAPAAGETSAQVPVDLLHALRAGDPERLASMLHNDLQQAALSLRPALGDTLALGVEHGALAGIVSGSGPTLAFLCATSDEAVDLQVTLSSAGLTALHAYGPVPGARFLPV